MNRQEAAQVVACIVAACPAQGGRLNREQIDAMINTFASLLDDLAFDQAMAALRVLLQTRSWMPSVADIRATVLEIARGPVVPGGEAWGSVVRAIREQGAHRNPGVDFAFSDPVTTKCVVAMGWRELCLSENQVADRARFIELYDRLATQSQRESQSPMLGAAREHRELGAGDVVEQLAKRLGGGS